MSGWVWLIVGVFVTSGVLIPLAYLHSVDLRSKSETLRLLTESKHKNDTDRLIGKIFAIILRTEASAGSSDWINYTQCVRIMKAFILHTKKELQK